MAGLIAALLLGTMVLLWSMTGRVQARMRRIGDLDPLTGALSRQAFIQCFEREAEHALRQPDARFAIVLMDVDGFRLINDAWGDRAGDRVLAGIVEIARPALREYDRIGRLECDVFAILMRGASGDAAAAMAGRMQRDIERQVAQRASLRNPVLVSVGVGVFGQNGQRWDELLRAAHTAARNAKADGGNRVNSAAPALLRPVNVAPARVEPRTPRDEAADIDGRRVTAKRTGLVSLKKG